MAVVDVYDAEHDAAPLPAALSHEEAVALIVKGRGTHFDPDVVDAFVRCRRSSSVFLTRPITATTEKPGPMDRDRLPASAR